MKIDIFVGFECDVEKYMQPHLYMLIDALMY